MAGKAYGFWALLLLLLTAGCTSRQAKVSFSFTGVTDPKVIITSPLDDIYIPLNRDTLYIKSDSVYTIRTNVKECAYLEIRNGKLIIPLIVQAGNDLTVVYDYRDTLAPYRVTGDNAPGQELFFRLSANKFPSKYLQMTDYTAYPLDTLPIRMWEKFEQVTEAEVGQLARLFEEGKIDKRFFLHATKEIQFYYGQELAKIIRKRYREEGEHMHPDFGNAWTRIYAFNYITFDGMPYRWFYEFGQMSPAFWEFKHKELAGASVYDQYGKADHPVLKEYLIGSYLISLREAGAPADEIIPLYKRFADEFPVSRYHVFLQPLRDLSVRK